MTRSLAMLATLFGLSLLGCGGSTVEAEPLGEVSQEIVTCTATCKGGTVSCTGSTCSANDYDGVMCDGVSTSCDSLCAGSPLPLCSSLADRLCANPGGYNSCCDQGVESYCVCSRTVPARNNCR